MTDIFSLSVEELALKIKSAEISSVEVCETYIERIKKFEKDEIILIYSLNNFSCFSDFFYSQLRTLVQTRLTFFQNLVRKTYYLIHIQNLEVTLYFL